MTPIAEAIQAVEDLLTQLKLAQEEGVTHLAMQFTMPVYADKGRKYTMKSGRKTNAPWCEKDNPHQTELDFDVRQFEEPTLASIDVSLYWQNEESHFAIIQKQREAAEAHRKSQSWINKLKMRLRLFGN